jgi:glycerol-3-phosphate cytidylyltransferase
MKTIITYGTFDCFHIGHLNLLKRARDLGGRLIVGVSSDAFNHNEKGKTTLFPYEERSAIVGALRCVDKVIPEESWSQKKRDIQAYHVDVFVIGDDWRGRFDSELEGLCQIEYLERTANISSTRIKSLLFDMFSKMRMPDILNEPIRTQKK